MTQWDDPIGPRLSGEGYKVKRRMTGRTQRGEKPVVWVKLKSKDTGGVRREDVTVKERDVVYQG